MIKNRNSNNLNLSDITQKWVDLMLPFTEDYSGRITESEKDQSDLINLETSDVVMDSTFPSFLNNFSYDQSGQLSFNANATYGASFLCSPNSFSACGINEINSLCFFNSTNKSSGATSSSFSKKKKSVNLPAMSEENTILASTTNGIYFNSLYLFLYSLYKDSFSLLPNSSASFSVSFDFATIDLNSLYSTTFFDIASLAILDQLNSDNESISCLRSSGIANVNVGIFNPPLAINASNYVYNVQLYKSFAVKASINDFGAILGKSLETCEEEKCMVKVSVSLS